MSQYLFILGALNDNGTHDPGDYVDPRKTSTIPQGSLERRNEVPFLLTTESTQVNETFSNSS